jgi:endonuclease/exonuclease/phosphatase family metal-dependent hydrolase
VCNPRSLHGRLSRPGQSTRRRVGLGLVVLTAACSPAEPTPEPVLLDGLFNEWSGAATILEDPRDAPESAIDIGSILGLDEPGWLYLSFELGREVNVQSLPGTLELLFDVDADAATGGRLHAMDGVDLVLEISQTEAPLVPGRGAGFALIGVDADGTKRPAVRYALGVTAAPSWAASRIELRLSRRGAGGLPAFASDLRFKAAYVGQGSVEDETDVGEYSFVTAAGSPALTSADARLAKPEGSVRVAQWNVASESFVQNAEDFARVLAAIEPDVILLDEVTGSITPDASRAFFALEPLSGLGAWQFVLGASGGRQRTVVAARDREIRPAESMETVRYPEGALEALGGAIPPDFGRLLELEAARGISSTGAWVEVGGREVLFVPVDLQSQGWTGSPHDQLRTLQARTVNEYVLAELGGRSAPVVIGGDLNLVGSRDPLLALIAGLDMDRSDLTPVDAERLGERTYATWRNPRGLFAPGRLDFLLVPGSAASVATSSVFTTEDLGEETLVRLGLERDLSVSISDHLVVVADLRLRP